MWELISEDFFFRKVFEIGVIERARADALVREARFFAKVRGEMFPAKLFSFFGI
jgi:hypothetical protein